MLTKPPACIGCPLYERSSGFSRPEGRGSLGVMLVGEALGRWERLDGLPFRPFAQAGSMLERVIRSLGYTREQFHLWNVVACEPPNDWLEGAPWEAGAIEHCRQHFRRILVERQPKVLVALGNVALAALTGMSGRHQSIGYLRGYVLAYIEDPSIPIIATYHPSFLKHGSGNFFGVLAHDIEVAVRRAHSPYVRHKADYCTQISLDTVRGLYLELKDNPGLTLVYDIETPNSKQMLEDERDDDPSFEIESVQFSAGPYTGMYLPHTAEFKPHIKSILALPNPKAGHNIWNYDDPRLRHNGYVIGGDRSDDTMWVWHHMQPDLPAHLQFVASYYGMDFPWKHLDKADPEFYGCADVDAPHRILAKLPQDLKKRGIYGGYERHVRGLHPILVQTSLRGFPVDNAGRTAMRAALVDVRDAVLNDIQALVPEEVLKLEPKAGYAKIPTRVKDMFFKELVEIEDVPKKVFEDPSGQKFRFLPRTTTQVEAIEGLDFIEDPQRDSQLPLPLTPVTVYKPKQEYKWFRQYLFNPASWQQVLRYMRARHHPVPKNPKKIDEEGNPKATTEKKELERLGHRTNDPFYSMVIDYREHDKMIGTYVDGYQPDQSGFVHTTWTYRPATGQLSSLNPNLQNIPKHQQDKPGRPSLAQTFRQMIRAKPGHRIVELDYKAFHALTAGFEARDALYMRMARHDIHSYLGCHVLKLPEAERLQEYDDQALDDFLRRIKKEHKHERDTKWKRAMLGYGFGMGYRTLYQQNRDAFSGEKECKALLDLLDHILAVSAAWRETIRSKAHYNHHLVSRYGFLRWFWDVYHWDPKKQGLVPGDSYNEAVAFLPANDAFGHIKDAMIRMNEEGLLEECGFSNQIHDALWFHMPAGLCDEMIPRLKQIMTQPNPVLSDPILAPEGLSVDVSVMVSRVEGNWADKSESNPEGMEEIQV